MDGGFGPSFLKLEIDKWLAVRREGLVNDPHGKECQKALEGDGRFRKCIPVAGLDSTGNPMYSIAEGHDGQWTPKTQEDIVRQPPIHRGPRAVQNAECLIPTRGTEPRPSQGNEGQGRDQSKRSANPGVTRRPRADFGPKLVAYEAKAV